jgi:hypothetical protein
MSDGVNFKWEKEPADLGRALMRYGFKMQQKVFKAAHLTGVEAAGQMKQERPWRDISGNARRGLRCQAVKEGSMVHLYFIHSVEYGVNLELGHAGRYAVIVPTMHKVIPRLRRRLAGVAE